MTIELVNKYARLIEELDKPHERDEKAGLVAFLQRTDITEYTLAKHIAAYTQSVEYGNGELMDFHHPIYHWIIYIEAFERKGTLQCPISREEIVARIHTYRKLRKQSEPK